MSTPWHLSNPSYLKRSPPASRQLISPDTSHSPDRESLYPENNPALLPLHPKSVAAPSLPLSVFLIFLFTLSLSLPIYSFPITSLCGLLFLSCLHLSLSNRIPLLFFLAQSLLPLSSLLRPNFHAEYIYASVDENLWKRCRDCRLRNTAAFPWGLISIQVLRFIPLVDAAKVGGSLSPSAPLQMEGSSQDHFRRGRRENKHSKHSLDTHHPKYTSLFGEKKRDEGLADRIFF